ncbi:dipeptide ABC transporter ATP-binding protein [Saccharothrix syringae]|uniref:ABC transporter ATP-binding protein n=1 Tax=Saccharothrix syringae TaxID=103733 RepID=A0A5Q0GZU6_SACSY|nr:ABC transporter ATP-binding protein [Saccharothrix syringae]QFZ19205.1 ABC transporter ATP-binding protein [Saccharothrix syringae]
MNLVEVEGLDVAFGPTKVVRDVSLHVAAGECLALVGESGSGKSVTARALLGLNRATVTARALRIGGRDARGFGERQWREVRGAAVGLVSQDALVSLDPLRRVGDEVVEPLRLHRRGERARWPRRVVEALAEAGVPEPETRARQYPHQLSGGLRQRALIAAALAAHPSLLIADEPTTALDVVVQRQVLRLLGELTAAGRGLLLISHDLAVVASLAHRVAVMRDGEVVETGPTDRVLRHPEHPYTRVLVDAARGVRVDRAPVVDGPALVEVDRVDKSFGARRAVNSVSLTVRAGETVGVVGESGSGKTTVARMVMGLAEPDGGAVRLRGEPWSGVPERARRARRRDVQLISQNPLAAFDPRWTVERIVGEGLPRGRGRKQRVRELLGSVGLGPELAARKPHQLSGGQRQRVAIARALGPDPAVLVCDEPVSALDVSVQAQVLDLLAGVQRRTGVALLFITHDLGVVRGISDRLVIMKDGVVVEEGATAEVFRAPRHPYTRELLAAVPRLDEAVARASG